MRGHVDRRPARIRDTIHKATSNNKQDVTGPTRRRIVRRFKYSLCEALHVND